MNDRPQSFVTSRQVAAHAVILGAIATGMLWLATNVFVSKSVGDVMQAQIAELRAISEDNRAINGQQTTALASLTSALAVLQTNQANTTAVLVELKEELKALRTDRK